MRPIVLALLLATVGLTAGCRSAQQSGSEEGDTAVPAPLFADPNYHGSTDPEVVWNEATGEWWVFYTARRATREQATYVGTPIGVAASRDWTEWRFVGYADFDGLEGRPDMPTTFWAPGIARDGDTYHMFVTRKNSMEPPWGGPGDIVHYRAPASDLLDGWKRVGVPDLAQPDPIDATLLQVDGQWRMWYRVARDGIHWATSPDLVQWEQQGHVPGDVNDVDARDFGYQEAPYVFRWKGRYWMLTDPHRGLAVYVSGDAVMWELQGRILEAPGTRAHDGTRARHPSVAVVGDRAFLFYHVEPWRTYDKKPEERTPQEKQSFLQVTELVLRDGRLAADRDRPVPIPFD